MRHPPNKDHIELKKPANGGVTQIRRRTWLSGFTRMTRMFKKRQLQFVFGKQCATCRNNTKYTPFLKTKRPYEHQFSSQTTGQTRRRFFGAKSTTRPKAASSTAIMACSSSVSLGRKKFVSTMPDSRSVAFGLDNEAFAERDLSRSRSSIGSVLTVHNSESDGDTTENIPDSEAMSTSLDNHYSSNLSVDQSDMISNEISVDRTFHSQQLSLSNATNSSSFIAKSSLSLSNSLNPSEASSSTRSTSSTSRISSRASSTLPSLFDVEEEAYSPTSFFTDISSRISLPVQKTDTELTPEAPPRFSKLQKSTPESRRSPTNSKAVFRVSSKKKRSAKRRSSSAQQKSSATNFSPRRGGKVRRGSLPPNNDRFNVQLSSPFQMSPLNQTVKASPSPNKAFPSDSVHEILQRDSFTADRVPSESFAPLASPDTEDVFVSSPASANSSLRTLPFTSFNETAYSDVEPVREASMFRENVSLASRLTMRQSPHPLPPAESSLISHLSSDYSHPSFSEISPVSPSRQSTSSEMSLFRDNHRSSVVKEMVENERVYVSTLEDIIEGYKKPAENAYPPMFTNEQCQTIFGDIERLHDFCRTFLRDLDSVYVANLPHLSQIGHCYVNHGLAFRDVYTEYCSNHYFAIAELQFLYSQDWDRYTHFFEACRRLRGVQNELPLEGFLLMPVQKLCRYPLQIAELLRHTPVNHPDFRDLSAALDIMRSVANDVNDHKEKIERAVAVAKWQNSVSGWMGPHLLDNSSAILFRGELTKYITSKLGSADEMKCTCYLLDGQMVFCSRDRFARNSRLSYRGRVWMQACRIVPCPDGRDGYFRASVTNAFKIFELPCMRCHLFSAKTPELCQMWLNALSNAGNRGSGQGYLLDETTRRKIMVLVNRESCSVAATPQSSLKSRVSGRRNTVISGTSLSSNRRRLTNRAHGSQQIRLSNGTTLPVSPTDNTPQITKIAGRTGRPIAFSINSQRKRRVFSEL